MKATAIVVALSGMLSFGVQLTEAKCFGDGAIWPNKELARAFA